MKQKLKVLQVFNTAYATPRGYDYKEEFADPENMYTENDVYNALLANKFEVRLLGIYNDIRPLLDEVKEFKPDVIFNMVEVFNNKTHFDKNIGALLDRYPNQLSGGQAQRVAMGRAIVRDPKVFLFDEPLSNLDAKLREQMRFEVRTLHNRLEATTIYVTHDQVEAMTMADKIMVMRDGLIQQVGSPGEVFDKPANRFVADFIGTPSINLAAGEIASEQGEKVFRAKNFVLPVSSDISIETGRKVLYGLRPQHIRVLTNPSETHPHIIKAQLMLSETTGTETQFSFNLNGHKFTVANQGRFDIPIDTTYRLGVDVDKAHFFDQASGERIEGSG